MHQFLGEKLQLPKLTQTGIDHLCSSVMDKVIEPTIKKKKKLLIKKSPAPDGVSGFHKHLSKN